MSKTFYNKNDEIVKLNEPKDFDWILLFSGSYQGDEMLYLNQSLGNFDEILIIVDKTNPVVLSFPVIRFDMRYNDNPHYLQSNGINVLWYPNSLHYIYISKYMVGTLGGPVTRIYGKRHS